MSRRKKLILNSSLIFVAIAPIVLYAYEYGPDPGYTGAPGDNATACIASGCHTGTLNSGKGSVKIVASGGTTYVPGQMQTISVTVTDPTERKYGFQLTARADSNPKTTSAGLLNPGSDGLTQVLCADGSNAPTGGCTAKNGGTLEWAEHTLSGYGKSGTPPSYTYTFNWTPPATNIGNVTLYAAGNAVTGALVVTGTETYTTSLQLTPSAGGGATPTVTAVVNDGSFTAPISTGSWVAILGTNLSPAGDARTWNPATEIINGKLPTSLDGTSVTVNGKAAVVEYLQPTQVNIQPPDDTATGPVPVVVTTSAGASTAFMVNLAQFAPGLFPGTAPYVVAQHADNSYVTSASPAKAGEVIILWGTGFGPANPAVPAGQVFTSANPLANTVTGTIGGQSAPIDFAGVVGAGLVQINVHVPSGLTGNVPVVLTVGGVTTQTTANMIPVQ